MDLQLRGKGGMYQGREVFVQSILGTMMSHAQVGIAEFAVFEGSDGVAGTLTGTLTAHSSGETFSLTRVELQWVVGDTIRRMDIHTKNPELLAGVLARTATSTAASET